MTAFAQTVPAEDGGYEVFPGQANSWVVDRDFSLAQGHGLQYSTALALYLGTPATPLSHANVLQDVIAGGLEPFPWDQDVAEITYLTPLFTTADGVRTAAASDGVGGVLALAGTRSGYLNGTSDSRIARTVTLAAGSSYTLSWKDQGWLVAGRLVGATSAPDAPLYRVVLRDPASGDVLQQLFAATSDFADVLHDGEALTSTLSGSVQLSFELRSAAGGLAVLDDVVLSEQGVPVAEFNGNFEASADLGPWSANAGAEIQNLRSGARAVAVGPDPADVLTVTRTFYSPPASSWARVVDVFENASAAAVPTTAVFHTSLGGSAPLHAIRAGGKAIVGWDADQLARDVAIVFGNGTAVVDPASGELFAVHALEVPAGGKVALVHFVVQLGRAEGGLTAADFPPGVDAVAQAIAGDFRTDAAYLQDLEPGVLNLIRNF